MSKIEDVKINTIWEDTKVKWVEKIETIYPETIELPNYQYWQSQNTLDYELALRNKPSWWGNIKTWYSSIPSWYTDFAITWLWFTPKAIQVVAQSWNKW